jgi:HK97 gp10 family phage protein
VSDQGRTPRGTTAGRRQGRQAAQSFSGAAAFELVLDQAALDELFTSEEGPVGKELARLAVKAERAAKQACPVDTGRLRSSITWRLGRDNVGLAAIIGTNVSYAPYVEFGTTRTPARPFLRAGIEAASR